MLYVEITSFIWQNNYKFVTNNKDELPILLWWTQYIDEDQVIECGTNKNCKCIVSVNRSLENNKLKVRRLCTIEFAHVNVALMSIAKLRTYNFILLFIRKIYCL